MIIKTDKGPRLPFTGGSRPSRETEGAIDEYIRATSGASDAEDRKDQGMQEASGGSENEQTRERR